MKTLALISPSFGDQRKNVTLSVIAAVALSIVLGLFVIGSMEEMVAYSLVALSCAVPVILWSEAGAKRIPVMPSVAAVYFIYYAVPIFRGGASKMGYEPPEILNAGIMVAFFLLVSTISWWLMLVRRSRQSNSAAMETISVSQLDKLMFLGLGLGILYYVALYMGASAWFGASFGFIRAVCLTTATMACFLFGHAHAQGLLQGRKWLAAATGLSFLILLSWANLFLVSGLIYCLASVFGYVITRMQVPWKFLGAAVVVVMILHAGKDAMRTKYWLPNTSYRNEISISEIPSLMAEWAITGVTAIASGDAFDSAIDRASLLNLLLRVQRLAPDYVPFLEGRSYYVIPDMMIPRFISPEKISSQAAMSMLNIHFGFQTVEGTQTTAIGWGVVAESYANFGYIGVFGIATLFGLIVGFFERWSDGRPLLSLPGLVAITAMMQFINAEADGGGLVTTLVQSVIAISLLFWISQLLSKKKNRLSQAA